MACRTCDHTMQRVGNDTFGSDRVFWCPRCGTINTERRTPDEREVGVVNVHADWKEPKLVHRAFQLTEAAKDAVAAMSDYDRSEAKGRIEAVLPSVEESITSPNDGECYDH